MTEVPSPCVRNCCLDEDDVCLGCLRTIEEIMRWGQADNKEKLEILEKVKVRLEQRLEKRPLK